LFHILPHLGRVRLAKLTPDRIEAYRDQYLLAKTTAATA
jgi:hypothetical protein